MQQAVVDAGRPLPQLTDPLEVELQVSAFVGPFADNEELWEVVVRHLQEVPSRRSAALLTALPQALTFFQGYEHVLLGLVMMLVMIFMRDGLLPSLARRLPRSAE